MRAPSASARSSSQVAVRYAKSKGGSLRMRTASKPASGNATPSRAEYQAESSSCRVNSMAVPRTPAVLAVSGWRQCRVAQSMAKTAWPRAAAARIMAIVESLAGLSECRGSMTKARRSERPAAVSDISPRPPAAPCSPIRRRRQGRPGDRRRRRHRSGWAARRGCRSRSRAGCSRCRRRAARSACPAR